MVANTQEKRAARSVSAARTPAIHRKSGRFIGKKKRNV